MASGDSWEFRIVSFGQSQLGENVLQAVEGVSTGAGASRQQIVDAVSASWSSILIPWLPTTFSFRGVSGRVYSPPADATNPIVSIVGQGVGTGTGVAPTQLSGLLSLKSALVGRRGQGRMYLPFPAGSMVATTGLVSAAGIAILANAKAALLAPISAGSGGNTTVLFYGVRSRKYSSSGTLVSAVYSTEFATQRRRGYYGRVNSQPF